MIERYLAGILSGLASAYLDVRPLIWWSVLFVFVDFVTGVNASYVLAKRAKERWEFSSRRLWDTIRKLVYIITLLVVANQMEAMLDPIIELRITLFCAGFVCLTEFWSFLENVGKITEHKLFKAIQHITKGIAKSIFTKKLGVDISDAIEETSKGKGKKDE